MLDTSIHHVFRILLLCSFLNNVVFYLFIKCKIDWALRVQFFLLQSGHGWVCSTPPSFDTPPHNQCQHSKKTSGGIHTHYVYTFILLVQMCVQTLKHISGPGLLHTSLLVDSTFILWPAWKLGGRIGMVYSMCPLLQHKSYSLCPLCNRNGLWKGWGTSELLRNDHQLQEYIYMILVKIPFWPYLKM